MTYRERQVLLRVAVCSGTWLARIASLAGAESVLDFASASKWSNSMLFLLRVLFSLATMPALKSPLLSAMYRSTAETPPSPVPPVVSHGPSVFVRHSRGPVRSRGCSSGAA